MNDKQLRAFLDVVEAGSISRAAKKGFISPQTLTYQLETLESELGYGLLERTPQGVSLTALGRRFKLDAEAILRIMRSATERTGPSNRTREVLRISPRSDAGPMVLAEICERFMACNPDVDLRFVALTTNEQFRDIRCGGFDVMECPDCERAHEPGLVFERVVSSPTCCLVRKNDPLAERDHIALANLEGRRVCLQSAQKCFAMRDLRARIARDHAGIFLVDMAFDAAQITIASLSDIVVVAPAVFARHNINPAVQTLLPLADGPAVDIGLVYAGSAPLPVVQRFLEVAHAMEEELT